MADELTPLAAALRDTYLRWIKLPPPIGLVWPLLEAAVRKHLSAAHPAAPPERPTCATCPYWGGPDTKKEGICRRRAPNWTTEGREDWAVTTCVDWCGDHPDFPAWIASRRATT